MAGRIDSLLIEDVRCFPGSQRAQLAPLTILVGENSSGKSTFLSLCRLAWDAAFKVDVLDFNEDPFSLGAYNEIAHYRGGKVGRARLFRVGFGFRRNGVSGITGTNDSENELASVATFRNRASQPHLVELTFKYSSYQASMNRSSERDSLELVLSTPTGTVTTKPERVPSSGRFTMNVLSFLLSRHARGEGSSAQSPTEQPERENFEHVRHLVQDFIRHAPERPYAVAPIRTKPERTYHPVSYDPRPAGGHVPMVLNREFSGRGAEWPRLVEALDAFGRASGLFEEISVRKLGKSESDPFQLQVKIGSPAFNLVDVGYGVSQVLPILVDAIVGEKESPILLQQPEVHLHPRAQAELASFLAAVAKNRGVQFIVETHSDHFVDRVRMDIRDKRELTPKDVSILYFARGKKGVQIQRVGIDSIGNVIEAPRAYRDFFLQEELRLLRG